MSNYRKQYHTFKQGDKVEWNKESGLPPGTGTICGLAVSEMPISGEGYIVHLDSPIENYDFECTMIMEVFLKRI